MTRSMLAGLAGTLANQMYIDVLANNIANVNTIGFREGRVTFRDMYYQTLSGGRGGGQVGLGGANPLQIGSGVAIGQIQTIHTQGSLRYTGAPLDAALEGEGMFVLSSGGNSRLYTRDGSFVLDDTQTLVSGTSGLYVLGWSAQNGVINEAVAPGILTFPIGQVRPGRATSQVQLTGNLDATLPVGTVRTATIAVYDSLGSTHQVTLTFTKTATPNEWAVRADSEGSQAAGTITFRADNGGVASGGTLEFHLTLSNGAASPLDFLIDMQNLTQLAQSGTTVRVQSQDGTPSATLTGISIVDGGDIQGEFSDGHVEVLGRLAVANFTNVGGLQRLGNNLYQEGANSGQVDIGAAGTGGRGMIRARQLELSNVDLTRSFVEVMAAQRGFQASTRVIAAANQLLEEVMQLNLR